MLKFVFVFDWIFMFFIVLVLVGELFIIVYYFCWCIGKDRYRWLGFLVFWCGWNVLVFVFWLGDVNGE